MSTAAERLKTISGLSGVTAGVMLLAIGTGATAGEILVDYSGLSGVTAAQHIMYDPLPQEILLPVVHTIVYKLYNNTKIYKEMDDRSIKLILQV